MKSVRRVSAMLIAAVTTNIILAGVAGIRLGQCGLSARLIILVVLVPGLFCETGIADVVKGSRIVRYLFNIR